MAIGLALLVADGEAAGLRAGADIGLRLDRPRAEQDLPMVLAGLHGESGRQRNDLRALLSKRLEQVGEAQIVADRTADGDAFAIIGDGGRLAGLHRRALVIDDAVRRRDVKEMDLAIARDLFALTVEDDSRIV